MLDPNAKRLLWYLFAGSKGGDNRIKVIDLLEERPYNMNQLAEALDLDYKSIQHHITVLEKITWLASWEKSMEYYILFLITLYLEVNIGAFNEIVSKIKKMIRAIFFIVFTSILNRYGKK